MTFPSSDLSRNSAKVFSVSEKTPVRVTRRDGEDLVLMSEHENSLREELLHIAAELIAATTEEHGSLSERMANRFTWMLALGDDDRATCATDLIRAARASFATGGAHLVMAELASWRDTAHALASGWGEARIDWLDKPVRVEHPS